MSKLVHTLSKGWHPVMARVGPDQSLKAFKECLDRGYVHIKFTNTQGGTELGIAIDPERSDFTSADLSSATGHLTLVGTLTLDYVNVQCTANIELPTLKGTGRLESLSA